MVGKGQFMIIDMKYLISRLIIAVRCGNKTKIDQLVRRIKRLDDAALIYNTRGFTLEQEMDLQALGEIPDRQVLYFKAGTYSFDYVKKLLSKFKGNAI